MLPITDPVLQFTLLVTAALIAERVAERARLPGLLGLLVLGIVLGPGVANVLPREPMVDFLGHVGLVYVMFLAGVEIDFETARAHAREAVTFGLTAFIASLLPTAAVASLLLGYDLIGAVLLGTLISSHTLLAYPIVQRLGLAGRTAVVTAVAGTLLTDTLALLLLAAAISGFGTGGHGPLELEGALGWIAPLALLGVLAGLALFGVPRLSRAFFRRQGVRRAEKALFALVVLLVLSSAAELIGTDAVLGAFLAGLALNEPLGRREDLREHIEFAGRMLFVPFFFVYTGMLLDPSVVTSVDVLVLAGALVLLVTAGKLAAAWTAGAIYGHSARERLLLAALTLPQAAATLAVTITAQEAGLLGREVVDAVIVVIFVTCVAGPLLVSRIGGALARDPSVRATGTSRAGGEEEPERASDEGGPLRARGEKASVRRSL